MIISLPNGKNLIISTYEFLFVLKESDVDSFYETCMADDMGVEIDNPFYSTEKPTGFIYREEIEDELLD